MRPEFRQALYRNRTGVMWIIWAAMLASPMFYVIVGWFVNQNPGSIGMDPEIVRLMTLPLGIVAVVLVGASLVFPRLVLDPRRLMDRLIRNPREMPPAPPRIRDPGGEIVPQSETEWMAYCGVTVFLSNSIVSWSFAEGTAIIGLMLTLLGQDMVYVLAGSVVSVVCLLLDRPRTSAIEELFSRIEDQASFSR